MYQVYTQAYLFFIYRNIEPFFILLNSIEWLIRIERTREDHRLAVRLN